MTPLRRFFAYSIKILLHWSKHIRMTGIAAALPGASRIQANPGTYTMKRTLVAIIVISAIQLGLTWYLLSEAIGPGLGKGIASIFGKTPPDTWLDKFVSFMGTVLTLPIGIVFGWLPNTTGNSTADGLLAWALLLLNSFIWGASIYFIIRRTKTFVRCRAN
jgi:hypothetical protein